MFEFFLVLTALFLLYLFIPSCRLSRLSGDKKIPSQPATTPAYRDVKIHVPEDAVLRRHFISQLRTEIQTDLSPRPADSILQRHYDALVAAELENRLTKLGRLQPC